MSINLISIVMPMRNAAEYLEECLDSIIAQTYSNWELIIVNDHSTDDCHDLVRELQRHEPRIQLYRNEGQGIIPALQLAYSKSKGDYITRMDADDVMPENKLELLLNKCIEKGRGTVSTGLVEYFANNGVGDGYRQYQDWLNGLTSTESNFAEIYKECVIPSPCWLMHRTDFENIGGFNSSMYPEDYDLCFRMYKNQLKVAGVQAICHLWRDHSNRASRNDDNYADNRFLEIKLKYFLELDYDKSKTLHVWGAGKKGKWIANQFLENGVDFVWLCNNPNKVGKEIYGQIISSDNIKFSNKHQYIIAVANKTEQKAIKAKLIRQEAVWVC